MNLISNEHKVPLRFLTLLVHFGLMLNRVINDEAVMGFAWGGLELV